MSYFNKLRPFGWLSLAVLSILIIFIVIVFSDHSSRATKQANQAEINIEKELTLKEVSNNQELSDYPGLTLHTELKEKEDHTFSINYPLTSIDNIDEPIETWIDEQKESFLKALPSEKTDEKNPFKAQLNIQVETHKLTDDIYSILLSAYHYTGGANGVTYVGSFTFDIEQETHISLDSLFIDPENETFISEVQAAINKIISEEDDYEEYIMQDLFEENMQHVGDWKWGINKDAFSLHFDEYEIGAGALGNISFDIPLDQLSSFVEKEWLDTFKLEEEKEEREKQAAEEQKKKEEKEKREKEEKKKREEESKPPENHDKYVALTFDDGPDPDVTPRILETLEQYDAKATFFMLGIQAEYYPKQAAMVADKGHEIANHSNSHADLSTLSTDQIAKEIAETNTKIEQATGKKPTLFRPPYGSYNDEVRQVADQHGLSIILWSVDSLDWKSRNENAIYSTIMEDVEVGSNILMHDIHPTTADALPEVLKSLSEQGYSFVTVSELQELQGQSGV